MKQLWVNLKEIEHNHVKTSNFRKLRMPEINSNWSNCYRSCWFHLEHVQLGSKVSTSGEVNKAPAHVAKIKTTKVHVHATTCPILLNTAVLNSCKHSEELMGNKTAVCVCVYFAWILFGNLHDNNISFARSNAFFCWHNSTALEFRCTRIYSISWWFPGRLLSIGSTPRPHQESPPVYYVSNIENPGIPITKPLFATVTRWGVDPTFFNMSPSLPQNKSVMLIPQTNHPNIIL